VDGAEEKSGVVQDEAEAPNREDDKAPIETVENQPAGEEEKNENGSE